MGSIKEPKKMGSPTKISYSLIDKIALYLKSGAYIETAVAACGISRETYYDWLRKAKDQKEGIYRDFSDTTEKAIAESQMRDLSVIDQASQQGQWKASAWRLERRFPKQWGPKQVLEHIGNENTTIQVSLDELNQEEKRLDELLKNCECES